MPVWSRKKKQDPSQQDAPAGSGDTTSAAGSTKPKKRLRADEKISSVLRETEPGAAMDTIREGAPNFVFDSGRKAAVLMLEAGDIGGLGSRHKNDEAKGSIVQLIDGDEIQTLVTDEMMNDEVLCFIPTKKTLDAMYEFSLLTSAPYTWGILDMAEADNDAALSLVVRPVGEPSTTAYGDAVSIQEGRTDVESVVGDHDGADESGAGGGATSISAESQDDEPEAISDHDDRDDEAEDADDEVPQDYPDESDDQDAPQDYPDDEDDPEPELDADEQSFYDDEYGEGTGLDSNEDEYEGVEADEAEYVDADGGEDLYRTPDPDEILDDSQIDEEQVTQTLTRRFLSGDLDLEVNLDAFEAQIGSQAPLVVFPEDYEEDDWLGRQRAELARTANVELSGLHEANLAELRRTYLSLVSRHATEVTKALDVNDPSTHYGKLTLVSHQSIERRRADSETLVNNRIDQVREDYDKAKEQSARAAAEAARVQYDARYGGTLDRNIADARSIVDASIDAMAAENHDKIQERRVEDAKKRMDFGQTAILDALSTQYQTMVAAEMDLARRYSKKMDDLVAQYRAEDIARTQATLKELEQSRKVEQVIAEYKTRDEVRESENRAHLRKLEDEIVALKEQTRAELAEREAAWDDRLQVERQARDSAMQTVDRLQSDLDSVNQRKDAEYAEQIDAAKKRADELRKERDDAIADGEAKVRARGWLGRAGMIAAAVFGLIALCLGILLGVVLSHGLSFNNTPNPTPTPTVTVTSQAQQQPAQVPPVQTQPTATVTVTAPAAVPTR